MFKQMLFPGGHCDGRVRKWFCWVFVAGLAGLVVMPALADKGDRHRGRGHGHDDHQRHGEDYREEGRQGEWRIRDDGYHYVPVYPTPYFYSQPVYVPPPVYYAPRQSPGITLFFPLDLR